MTSPLSDLVLKGLEMPEPVNYKLKDDDGPHVMELHIMLTERVYT